MDSGVFDLISEKIDHLYALQMAGFSTVAGLLFASLTQRAYSRALTEEEIEKALLRGREELLEAYLEALHARGNSQKGKPPKNE